MTCHKKANNVDKSSAVVDKGGQLHGSPVKEHVVLKPPLPTVDVTTVYPQNNYSRAVHNKENAAGRDHHETTVDQGLEDSGYLSLHNSHVEDVDESIHEESTTHLSAPGAVYLNVTPNLSPMKCQDTRASQSVSLTPVDFHKEKNDTFSTSSTPANHHKDRNLPILKFNQAVCEELSKSFQKYKRFDWSIIPKLAEDYNLDRVIGGHMGEEHIDIFSSLLSRNMKCILAQILALLGDLDLISCRKVSRTWKKIICEDLSALKRCQRTERALRGSEFSQKLASGLTRDLSGVSRVVLSSMQCVASSSLSSQPSSASLQSCRNKEIPSSSLNSKTPNCTRFSQYVEAANTLKQHESLRHCKRCGSPAAHSREAQKATCLRSSCQFDFCTCCHEAFHGSTPCRVVQPRAHFHTSKTSAILPGSARSKRNVRRL
ncbi:hypothetical protein WMY93_018869 [Mugilogobius chulae]|uniref:ZBR-type domain-containing protein n=1 Tax=Mugilogobius chulae TaxID=88201 RepID=A0AAW0NVB3_9GOBI